MDSWLLRSTICPLNLVTGSSILKDCHGSFVCFCLGLALSPCPETQQASAVLPYSCPPLRPLITLHTLFFFFSSHDPLPVPTVWSATCPSARPDLRVGAFPALFLVSCSSLFISSRCLRRTCMIAEKPVSKEVSHVPFLQEVQRGTPLELPDQ